MQPYVCAYKTETEARDKTRDAEREIGDERENADVKRETRKAGDVGEKAPGIGRVSVMAGCACGRV